MSSTIAEPHRNLELVPLTQRASADEHPEIEGALSTPHREPPSGLPKLGREIGAGLQDTARQLLLPTALAATSATFGAAVGKATASHSFSFNTVSNNQLYFLDAVGGGLASLGSYLERNKQPALSVAHAAVSAGTNLTGALLNKLQPDGGLTKLFNQGGFVAMPLLLNGAANAVASLPQCFRWISEARTASRTGDTEQGRQGPEARPPIDWRRVRHVTNTCAHAILLATGAAISGYGLANSLRPAVPAMSVMPVGRQPITDASLPAHWLADTKAVNDRYDDLIAAVDSGSIAAVKGNISATADAIGKVGGYVNLQTSLDYVRNMLKPVRTTTITGSNLGNLFHLPPAPTENDALAAPVRAAAKQSLTLWAQNDGVGPIPTATDDIWPADYDPTGRTLPLESFDTSASKQGGLGDCVTLATINGFAQTAAGQQILQRSIKDDGNGSFTTGFQGGKASSTTGKRASYKVTNATIDGQNNDFVIGNPTERALAAGLNAAFAIDNGYGIGRGLKIHPVGRVLAGDAAGRQTITSEGASASQIAAYLQRAAPKVGKDMALLVAGEVDQQTGRLIPTKKDCTHAFTVLQIDPPEDTQNPEDAKVVIRNPWYIKPSDYQNTTVGGLAKTLANSCGQLQAFNFEK